jgi:hypothetical protein
MGAVVASSRNPLWTELIQLVPVVSLALPFIVAGKVDLAQAGAGLVIGAMLTLPVTGLVVWKQAVLNPILLGTALWLWAGAVAFSLPVPPLREALIAAQGFGLFAGVIAVAVPALLWSPEGFIGCRSSDGRFVRRASLALFALALAVLAWSWAFRADIRLGGGLPFIVLNVARRAIVRRAPPEAD